MQTRPRPQDSSYQRFLNTVKEFLDVLSPTTKQGDKE